MSFKCLLGVCGTKWKRRISIL